MKNTINQLIQYDNHIWDKYGYTSRPNGRDYIYLVLELAGGIATAFKIEELTQEVQDILTNENYHTLNQAIDIVKHLNKYA